MHETGCLGLMHWDDPEGWDREGGGREGEDGDQKPLQYYKVISLQLK